MRRFSGAVLSLLLCALVAAPLAFAQDEQDQEVFTHLQVQSVDSRNPDAVEMLVGWSGAASALESSTIVENGDELSPSSVALVPGTESVMVLAVDTSDAMLPGDALIRLKRAMQDMVTNRPSGQPVGIVSFGGGAARVVQRPTTDNDRLITAIEDLAPGGSAAMFDGIDTAARMVTDNGAPLGHVVIVAAGPNGAGTVTAGRAQGSITNSGAATWVIAFDDRGAPSDFLRNLVASSGGRYAGTVNVDAAVDYVDEFAEQIANHYDVTYASAADGGPIDLTLQVGSSSTSVSFVSGSSVAGATALQPVVAESPSGIGFLRDNGFALGLILAVVAAVLAAFAIGSLIAPDRSSLDSALEVYTDGPGGSTAHEDDDGSGLARTALIQRAVGMTEEFAESRGFLATIEGKLERADLPLRAAEAIFFYAAAVTVLVVLTFVLTGGNVLGTLVASGLIALLPLAILNFLAKRRQKKFVSLLPDTLQLLAGTLRAGYSLMQGVEAVSREVSEPMGKELRRIVTEARLGRPLEEALDASAARMASPDFEWAVMAIRIQREVGGNLAELLMTVGDTMTQRERLRRDVDALTAEGRISAIVLGLLPVGLGVAIWMMSPEYINVLFTHPTGKFLLGGAIILAGFGFYWMKKVIEVDI